MCNLYNQTTAKQAMTRLFAGRNVVDRTGNTQTPADSYPDYNSIVIRMTADEVEMIQARWGMPTPPQYLAGKKVDKGVTNVRRVDSPHWRRWLGPANRCLVPFDKFVERDVTTGQNVTFALASGQPAYFAGIWTTHTSVRKIKDGPTTDDLYAFLTTEPNAEVRAVHPKAMPVILTTPGEWETWLTAPWEIAKLLQRPLPDESLHIINPTTAL